MVGRASVTLALLLFQGAPVSRDKLLYPPLARAAGIQGTVIFEFGVGDAGQAVDIAVFSQRQAATRDGLLALDVVV